MNVCYFLSFVYLILMFMGCKKSDKKLCLISSIIYSFVLLFCYNTFVIYLIYLFGINGSMLLFSIINYFVGSIIGIIILVRGNGIQKYFIDKKKLLSCFIVGILIFILGYFRFRGFNAIAFASGDSGIHYGHTLKFSQELSILDINNTKNDVYGYFVRVMPISYINGGLLFNILSNVKSYVVFMWFNVCCLVLSGLLFLVTLFDIYSNRSKNNFYFIFFTMLYILAFPLNNFIMGFCYLSQCIMVINLLCLTVYKFKDKFNEDIIFKIIVLFLILFSCFYSYYLFVPVIYMAVGLYYIYLCNKKIITFKQFLLYGLITLGLPFVIGYSYFFVTLFEEYGVGIVSKTLNTNGYCYVSVTSLFLFIFGTIYLAFDFRKRRKFDFLTIILMLITIYIVLFLVLFILERVEVYYLFKLFSLYWLFLLLYVFNKIIGYRKRIYFICLCLFGLNIYVYLFPLSDFSSLLVNSNIYSYNARHFSDRGLIYESYELDILEKSTDYNDICVDDRHFLLLGGNVKHIWAYFITDNIPVVGSTTGHISYLFNNKLNGFKEFEEDNRYRCLIYYYEDRDININKDKYDVLYENDKGAIIKKKNIS